MNNTTTHKARIALNFDCCRKFSVYAEGEKIQYCGQDPIFNLEAGDGVLLVLE